MRDWSISAWMTGFLAVLISYSGPLVIFIQAAHAGNMSNEMLSSWIWAISIGAGISGIVLSVLLKAPIITAWSAPGTALLLNLFPNITMPEVVGAYLTAAVISVIVAFTGSFERIVKLVPQGIAAAMIAGILFQFGMQAFISSSEMPGVIMAMVAIYLLGRRFIPKFTVIIVALAGFASVFFLDLADFSNVRIALATPIFTWPEFNLPAFFSFTIPLVVVSLTGQFLPGLVILRMDGYERSSRAVVGGTSLISIVMAFFGGISIVLAAITAALCTGKESHPDPKKRYVSGIANGVFYLIGGTFAGTIVLLFSAIPSAVIAALAGLALIGAIVANIRLLCSESTYIEPAVICFMVTASNMSIGGMGSAFWGIVLGMLAYWISSYKKVEKQS
ncbi:Inner membrane protein ydcO [Oligella ureolytica]|uniref:Benzoate/H(+) symporter BenE family transporter n=1 Tax=Oligella ureolytica TaxID=90244 RepID=A0A378XHK1_9BURK|nr:benzoate/H(+) symporter BenE family transporter [Oligella ureolytica]QPT38974.1 benzoate/H(+) symporter BenE family transporter [Oligella ureolytica]SUA54322.1 Inner membrane protein ydcO [Oligella ureolytica]SUA54884.1 Inner membrane protein ydcO [Oligella ureolytica]